MAQTQLLLLEDVDSLGRKGDVVSTKAGYAFNFLIPQGLALQASAHVLRRQKKLQEERLVLAQQEKKEADEMSSKLHGETFGFTVKVDHEGHMYGSVSTHDIADLIKMQTGVDVEKRFIVLKHAIKQTGVFDIQLRFKEGVAAQIHIKVMPEHAHE